MHEGKSEIPADIEAAAWEINLAVEKSETHSEARDVIAKALLAERQRCAKIADDEADKLKLRDGPDKRRDPLNKQLVAMKVICRDVSASIRGELNHG